MGIEKFFNSLVKNETLKKDNLLVLQNKITTNYIYIDFNSILYKIAQKIELDLNKLLYELLLDGKITNESALIAKKWNYNIHDFNTKSFKEYFNDKFIEDRFIDFVYDDLIYIFEGLLHGEKIKKIYISMDGIPNMAKITEQKKRRYMGYILNESKKEILSKNKKNMDQIREKFEENKIRFSRGKILGYHEFMIKISNALKDDKFIDQLKAKFKELNEYIFSGSDVPGEGEKKIMEDILLNKNSGKYVIYSPDADLIILSSIMLNKLNDSEMYILRFDQQNLKYDIVDIKILNSNIYNYINKHNYIKKKILDDIMFIFTMFGNDFVHKIESIDAKKDFEILLDSYKKYLSLKNSYIIDNNKIIYSNLREFINILSDQEKDLMNDVYLIRNFKNYNHLKGLFKDIFWFSTLHRTLINYINLANIVFKFLRKWEKDFNNNNKFSYWNSKKERYEVNYKNIQKHIDHNISYLINELNKNDFNTKKLRNNKLNYSIYIHKFIKIFMKIELNVDMEVNEITDENLYVNFLYILKNEIFKHNGNKIYSTLSPNIKLEEYNYTTKDKYHSNKIKESLVSSKMNITEYDIEAYAFEYMLDKYKSKLNAVDDNIGKCRLNYINNQYIYIYDVIEKYHEKYYKIYFGDIYNKSDICKKYFEGISWVYDFYFIKNDPEFNYNNISPWFYEYHRSPLLIDLNIYLNSATDQELDTIHKKTVDRLIKRDNFINPFEHYLYVTPKNTINLNSKYQFIKKIINDNPKIFPDLDIIIEQIFMNNSDKEQATIDCRRVNFLSKCTLNTVKDIKFNEFMEVVTKERSKYDNLKVNKEPYLKGWNRQYGGSKKHYTLEKLKKNYKMKYLETQNIEFKKMYKMTKKLLKQF